MIREIESPTISKKSTYWVDEEESFIKEFVQEEYVVCIDSNVETESDPKEACNKIGKSISNYCGFAFDLDLKQKLSGIDLFREVRKNDENIPISFVTGNSKIRKWKIQLSELENEYDEEISIVRKAIGIITKDTIPHEFAEMERKCRMFEKLIQNPFKFSLEEFSELSKRNKDRALDKADELSAEIQNSSFKVHGIEWIVLAELNDKITVILDSNSNKSLNNELLTELANEVGKPVFTYMTPRFVEEINKVDVVMVSKQKSKLKKKNIPKCNWEATKIKKDDFYPSICFKLVQSKIKIKADFDTGSAYNFISFPYLEKMGFQRESFWEIRSKGKIWGTNYRFYRFSEDICFWKKDSFMGFGVLNFEAVINWSEVFEKRQNRIRMGLIGRSFAINNKLSVIIDGKNLTTEIL